MGGFFSIETMEYGWKKYFLYDLIVAICKIELLKLHSVFNRLEPTIILSLSTFQENKLGVEWKDEIFIQHCLQIYIISRKEREGGTEEEFHKEV